MKYLKVHPTDQDLEALAKIPFSEPVLEELKNTHILAAVFPLSILEIRKMSAGLIHDLWFHNYDYAKLFYDQDWYNDESFAKERGKERGETSWQLVRRTPLPNSTSKSWSKQLKLLSRNDEVPTARVMVYTIIGHYLVTGERLFKDTYVRTSSVVSDGDSVGVGYFSSGGLGVYHDRSDYYYYSPLGVSSARKF